MQWIVGVLLVMADIAILRYRRQRRSPAIYPEPKSLIQTASLPAMVTREADGAYTITIEPPRTIQKIMVNGESVAFDVDDEANTYRVNPVQQSRPIFEATFNDGTTYDVAERILALEGVANFRDVGGYPTQDGRFVRWGKVYRSGSLHDVSEQDADFIQRLGINHVCDMRSPEEVKDAPDKLPNGIGYDHFPLRTENQNLSRLRAILMGRKQIERLLPNLYTHLMIDRNPTVFGSALKRLAQPENLPALIHCTAGKDRTGVAIALLLLHLGVPDEYVIADYTLSNLYFDNYYAFARSAVRPLERFGVSADDLIPLLLADGRTLEQMIAQVRTTYGSVTDYLRDQAGVSQDELDRLKALLLTD